MGPGHSRSYTNIIDVAAFSCGHFFSFFDGFPVFKVEKPHFYNILLILLNIQAEEYYVFYGSLVEIPPFQQDGQGSQGLGRSVLILPLIT